ncbi:MAG: ydiB [Firmicutes bacterium]|nr:ydiB [Bacillota bacterium]
MKQELDGSVFGQVMISGSTKLVGLIGWPVEHTLSPLIQNSAFRAAGLDYAYVPLGVKPEELHQAIAGLKALGFAGVNVTVPHKVKSMEILDSVDSGAKLVGAVNTVVFTENRSVGYNTDMQGFIHSLAAKQIDVKGKRAVLLGAGGAARAVVCGLIEHGAASVTIGGRAEGKVKQFAASFSNPIVEGYGLGGREFGTAVEQSHIIINCTPVGMYPNIDQEPLLDWELVPKEAAICDLIYNPPLTRFLQKAQALGHTIVGGAGMLVEQGALAFSLWTGMPAPRAVMHQALANAIKE